MIEFFVCGIPQTKGSTKSFYVKKKGAAKGRVVTTNDNPKNKEWAATVHYEALRHKPALLPTGPVHVWYTFHLKAPKHIKDYDTPHITKPDLDKVTRSANDAMIGVMYKDDSQIVHSVQGKVYGKQTGVQISIQYE